jgi:hypothetical protein
MSVKTLVVNAARDAEAGVWFIESSDLPGLNVEAGTLDELVQIVADLAPDLMANLPALKRPLPISVRHVVQPRAARAA